MPKTTLLVGAVIVVLLMTAACSDDTTERACTPGETQPCLCGGGVSGAQACADDGTRWLACDCGGADADADADSDADADGAEADATCIDDCPALDAARCSGTLVQRCATSAEGCLEWTPDRDCTTTGATCVATAVGAGCSDEGRCSQTGGACSPTLPCPAATVTGFCVTTTFTEDWHCGYDNRHAAGDTAVCGSTTFHRCESDFDCPTGSACGDYGDTWCGTAVEGLCAVSHGAAGTCSAATSCVLDEPNVCVTCGDGTLQPPQEECDDGNSTAGDGCSPSCRFEGTCVTAEVYTTYCGCAREADCADCSECEMDGPCTCDIP